MLHDLDNYFLKIREQNITKAIVQQYFNEVLTRKFDWDQLRISYTRYVWCHSESAIQKLRYSAYSAYTDLNIITGNI